MIDALNIWHYVVLTVIFLFFLIGFISALREKNAKMRFSMLFTVILFSLFMAVFSVFVVNKYTKHVKLYNLKNSRLLSLERISYTGIVKNVGNYPIGKVTLEIKLVNRGNATGNVKGGSFYRPSGFFGFFTGGFGIKKSKPQTVVKRFVVARNLKAGHAKQFYVYFRFPPYFSSVSQFTKLTAD
ncbi:hypothetical protein MNB_SM-5-653 [hydrothermal vent metagenome]|uniref:DUF2393 domain-containing protein n=1 Tax=hydrothermal vent metagenome TaxID=652676 RepID=A0A1W1CQ16_9ZZZZ